jgi:hypothetical protein
MANETIYTPLWVNGKRVPVIPGREALYQAALKYPYKALTDPHTEFEHLSHPIALTIVHLIERASVEAFRVRELSQTEK